MEKSSKKPTEVQKVEEKKQLTEVKTGPATKVKEVEITPTFQNKLISLLNQQRNIQLQINETVAMLVEAKGEDVKARWMISEDVTKLISQ
jgi:hypothetical protein